MKKILTLTTFSIVLVLSVSSNAQITTSSTWTWMKGDNEADRFVVYGTRGVASAANKPGGRSGGSSWKDTAGNFWLFGGGGFATRSISFPDSFGGLSDLWKYNLHTNQWTWVNGGNTIFNPPWHGAKGIPGGDPGVRSGSSSWTDTAGNLWLFGGLSLYGSLNDLWKYSPATIQWTWINGSNAPNQPGTYGVRGTPSATNMPGARWAGNSWTDAAGNFWLFGGKGYAVYGSSSPYFNDLWKYDPAINQWTWINGGNSINQPGVYGTMGTPSATNMPGARELSSSWADAAGNLWLFGGQGYAPPGSSRRYFNDLWKYDLATNQWTWVKGADTINPRGVYGTMGTPSAANMPEGRAESMTWTDTDGNLWLFGGLGYAPFGSTSPLFNDLWKYSPATNQWTWVKGDTIPFQRGVYGTMGTPSAANMPGGRSAGNSWTDAAGNLWLFGGESRYGGLNDLWKLGNNSALPVTLSSVKAYQQNSGITIEWKVENESGIKQYDVEKSSDGITFTKVAVQAANGNNLSTVNYSWRDLNPITGNNFYRIRILGLDGEIKYSQIMKVSIGKGKPAYEVYPNPVTNGTIQLQFINQVKGVYQVRLLNTFGQAVFTDKITREAGSSTQTVKPGSHILKGNYILEITAPDKSRQSLKIIY